MLDFPRLPTKGLLAKIRGISMLVEFSHHPVCHASVSVRLSLPPPSTQLSVRPSIIHHPSIHPSLHPSIYPSFSLPVWQPSLPSPGWQIDCSKLGEQGSLWGQTLKHQSARPSFFNENLKPQQLHLHTQSPHTYCHMYVHTLWQPSRQTWVHYLCHYLCWC